MMQVERGLHELTEGEGETNSQHDQQYHAIAIVSPKAESSNEQFGGENTVDSGWGWS